MGRGFKSSRQRQYYPPVLSRGYAITGAGGEIPKWPKGADCKSAGVRLRRFKSSSPHHLLPSFLNDIERVGRTGGNSSAVERQPSKLGVAGSNPVSRSRIETRGVVREAHIAQLVEHALGKGEVSGSIPDMGSRIRRTVVAVSTGGK